MLRRVARRGVVSLFVLASLLVPRTVGAQDSARSVVADLLDRIVAHINDLRYDDAITSARLLTRQASTLSESDRVRLHLLLAAAFFPAERPLQRPDSARVHLDAAIRLAPDASYPADLRWRGLDSLLAATKTATLAAVLRAGERQPIGGPGIAATVTALASAPSDLEFQLRSRLTGEVVRRDRQTAITTVFRIGLHDGTSGLLAAGTYDALLIVRRDGRRDSLVVAYAAIVEAPALTLEAEPVFDANQLRPESLTPNRGRTLRTAGIAALSTLALGTVGRSNPELESSYAPDARAYFAATAIGGAVALFALRPRARAIPANVAANSSLRTAHQRSLDAVRARNADRLAQHVGELTLRPAGR
jgi:hypothetical protein